MSSTYDDVWKLAEVIPLLKEGYREVASNNRPQNMLAIALKICEKVALNQLTVSYEENESLSTHQNGNKKSHST